MVRCFIKDLRLFIQTDYIQLDHTNSPLSREHSCELPSLLFHHTPPSSHTLLQTHPTVHHFPLHLLEKPHSCLPSTKQSHVSSEASPPLPFPSLESRDFPAVSRAQPKCSRRTEPSRFASSRGSVACRIL